MKKLSALTSTCFMLFISALPALADTQSSITIDGVTHTARPGYGLNYINGQIIEVPNSSGTSITLGDGNHSSITQTTVVTTDTPANPNGRNAVGQNTANRNVAVSNSRTVASMTYKDLLNTFGNNNPFTTQVDQLLRQDKRNFELSGPNGQKASRIAGKVTLQGPSGPPLVLQAN